MAKKLPAITNYFGLVVSKGTPAAAGSRSEPIGRVIGIGEDWDTYQKDIAPGATLAAWTRLSDPLFDFLRLSLLTPGALDVAMTYDTPTSWSNLAASGSREFTQHLVLSGLGVMTLSPFAMTSPTVHPTTVTTGLPAVLNASDRTYAMMYRLQLKNAGNETVRVRLDASAVFGT